MLIRFAYTSLVSLVGTVKLFALSFAAPVAFEKSIVFLVGVALAVPLFQRGHESLFLIDLPAALRKLGKLST